MMSPKKLGRIGVVMGGTSSEREISLKSGKAVLKSLVDAGCDAIASDLTTTDAAQIVAQLRQAKIDIVFIVLHGKFGEDGAIQAILEKEGFPYTGSGPKASRLAMDKAATQALLKKNGITVPDFQILRQGDAIKPEIILKNLGGAPVIVKPCCEGSSIGITIIKNAADLMPALQVAFKLGTEVIIEKFIAGKEITSGILGQDTLSLVEIRPKNKFFDFVAKYQSGMSDYIVPAEISAPQTTQIKEMSLKAFQLIGCRDMARSDFILDEKGKAFFLEINTIPGFTATSLLPKAAQDRGIDFTKLCLQLAGYAAQRKKQIVEYSK